MKNTRVMMILALAIIMGLAAGYSALQYLGDRSGALSNVGDGPRETQPVVLASKDLPLGTVLAQEDLVVTQWPAENLPVGFASSPEELLGRSLVSNVRTNEVILASKLAEEGLLGLPSLIPQGLRALSVRVNDVIGVAGFVTPRTRVDVILIMTPPGGREPISKTILQNIQALAAGQQIQETEDGKPISVTVVTVLVTPEQAERLSLAAQEGQIQMALRNTLDLEAVETPGERTSRLFAGTGGGGGAQPSARRGAVPATPQESVIEIYRGGARTLISY